MSSGKFYTNSDILLSEVIKSILPTSDKLHFLVGYFYFSGFNEVYNELKDKKIRILVGMDAELDIKNKVKEVYNLQDIKIKNPKNTFINQLKEVFNKSDIFDNEGNQSSINIFIEKIANNTLEIRRTKEPNHSKLYLFEEKDELNHKGLRPGTLITGSSNFTYSGLTGRHELNAMFNDKQSFEDGKKIFDELWNKSIPLTSGGEDDDLYKMLKEETWLKMPKPFLLYLKLLQEYSVLNNTRIKLPSMITDNHFSDLEYQIDAIKSGIRVIKEHNGVMIADVVGLGKSIIGSAILYNLQEKAIIIAPPHLKDQWEDYMDSFNFKAKIFTSGSIEEALKYDRKTTHKPGVVLIDECHKYRNNETIDYGNLHQLCQGKKVILLTATPFNNEPNDVFNLIKLFQTPKNSTLQTAQNLMEEFRRLQAKYEELKKRKKEVGVTLDEIKDKSREIALKIRDLISPVVIRRSRIDLKNNHKFRDDLKKQGYEISEVEEPVTIEYSLGKIESIYTDTLNKLIESDDNGKSKFFKGARYMPLTYIRDEKKIEYESKINELFNYSSQFVFGRQLNMAGLIRRLLVSRFESSIFAFINTLNSLIVSIENIEKYIEHTGTVPFIKKGILPDFNSISLDNEDELEEVISKYSNIEDIINNKSGFSIKISDLEDTYFEELKSDKDFLLQEKEKWEKVNFDPKLESFKEKLKEKLEENNNRKIVIFSQYKDTVKCLTNALKNDFRVLGIDKGVKNKKTKLDIKLNFDAGVSIQEQKNDYDIIVATDAISEGYNLHRAGIIFNYDIPYNPVRVIQRIGRINRINKKIFDKLFIFNYFPSLIGEVHINTKQISTLKISMINAILGTDVKTLTKDEELSSFYKEIIKEDDILSENESWEVKYLNFLYDIQRNYPHFLETAMNLPERARCRRSENKGKTGVLICGKKGDNLVSKFIDNNNKEIAFVSLENTFSLVEAKDSEEPLKVSNDFYNDYTKLKEVLFLGSTVIPLEKGETIAIQKVQHLYDLSNDSYFSLLEDSILLGDIPKVFIDYIKNIKIESIPLLIEAIKEILPEDYLNKIKYSSQLIEDKGETILFSEEF